MTEKNDVILSICIGTYNRKNLLMELINTILEYDGYDIEVIVCDNASTDGTWEAIKDISDARVKTYRNEQNYGAMYNWLRSLLYGTGKYVMNVNDRELLDMSAVRTFVNEVRDLDVDGIVACGHTQSDTLNIKTYEDRVCLRFKLGEPGDVIYSQNVLEKYRALYGENLEDELRNNVFKCFSLLDDIALYSENWLWYSGKRLLLDRSMEEIGDIKVNRQGKNYVFIGCPGGQLGICKAALERVGYLDVEHRMQYMRGVIKAYAHTLIWTTIRAYANPDMCRRYNFVPPEHTFWLKEVVIWSWRIKQFLKQLKVYNREIGRFIDTRVYGEYTNYVVRRVSESKTVQGLVSFKHRFIDKTKG